MEKTVVKQVVSLDLEDYMEQISTLHLWKAHAGAWSWRELCGSWRRAFIGAGFLARTVARGKQGWSSLLLKDPPCGKNPCWSSSWRTSAPGKAPCWSASWRTVSRGRDLTLKWRKSVRRKEHQRRGIRTDYKVHPALLRGRSWGSWEWRSQVKHGKKRQGKVF